jgi:hypothetical protein
VAAVNLFVEHRGGASFGQSQKAQLLAQSGAELSRRYPAYDRQVQDFIRTDPLVTSRLALGLDWAALTQKGAVPIYLAHALGGGAESWLRQKLKEHLGAAEAAVVLRVGLGRRWGVELHSPLGLTQGLTDDTDLLMALLLRLPQRRVVYSCGVGERQAQDLPDLLLALSEGGAQELELLFHDFFPISPSYTLLGEDGVYRGVPRPGRPTGEDPAHIFEAPGGVYVPLSDWQAAWGRAVDAAHQITVFSQNSADIISAVWPEASARIRLSPHRLHNPPPRLDPAPGKRPVTLAALGNIGMQKGAGVLERLSQALKSRNDLRLVVLGHLDPDYRLAGPSLVHGSYDIKDIPALVQRYQIDGWIIPSIWPETFSFTTHEAIATGLPVLAFDLGAQGEAVAQSLARGGSGAVLDLGAIEAGLEPDHLLRLLGVTVGTGIGEEA